MDAATTVMQALIANENAGLVMDFDGVLSRITEDPDASELLPGTKEILSSLATRLSVVALLSGRPAGFLAARASIPGVELYGSYGLEHLTENGIEVVPEAQQWMTAVRAATQVLHRELDNLEGIYVEEKSLAVAVHWRRAPDRDSATKRITPLVQEVIDTHGLRHEPGKFVEELRMPLKQDKGTALQRIINAGNIQTVAYAGDDRGDMPAFEAATAAGGHALVIDGADMAPEVSNIAGAHFDSPEQFQSWLQQLSAAVR
ncbi:trehalose-phosphatase [Arthrobacter sp. zg-Y20]|uniref:trehalose-phosphatase n=1 Tax=unclassified Arthrobacter TaxID=235627 RepID=UPI001D144182|nr:MULTISPECIES: trehalose-phosphatase [unclassified Arthrobacter]MCC3276223.1 trehalose-phosphatase [Arthrobacter sp. zg-Y20]MDK1316383.1 trehalose-phosphatase [Arthrobacter sp. zg.Y20]WIB06430.1 trehalose-phosphatase [Arthrobacter sp. zg-Y20]